MIVGVPKEIKRDEYRVALLPVGVEELTRAKHQVLVEKGAGLGSGIPDERYVEQGATLVDGAAELFAAADMIMKVKEPLPAEWPLLRRDQIVFTYFHFAADRKLTEAVLESGCTAVAYETLRDDAGRLPLLTPMSEVAGRMSIQEGAKYLERPQMGRGILLGGVPGVAPRISRSWGAASWGRMPPRWRPGSAPILGCWTSTWSGCGISTTSCPLMSIACSATAIRFAINCRGPTW